MFSSSSCYINETSNVTIVKKMTAVLADNTTVEVAPIKLIRTITTGFHRRIFCDALDVTNLLLMLSIFFVNIALFLFILTHKKLRNSKANKHFLNLQLVHLMLSVSGCCCVFLPSHHPIEEVIVNNGLLLQMFLALILTTLDRYLAIQYPYRYEKIKTRSVFRVIAATWVLTFVFIGVSLYFKNMDDVIDLKLLVVSTAIISIAIVVLCCSNLKVHLVAKHAAETLTKNKHTKILKSTYVCFALVFSFVVSWLPYLVQNILRLCKIYHADGSATSTRVLVQVAFMNCLLDPILFVAFRKDAKKEVGRIFKRRHHDGRKRALTQDELLN